MPLLLLCLSNTTIWCEVNVETTTTISSSSSRNINNDNFSRNNKNVSHDNSVQNYLH